MAINRDAFIGNYLEEAYENIQSVEKGILRFKKDPDNEEELNSIMRSLHTIKGSSRMLKFSGMEQTAHAMENLFKGIREKRYALSSQIVQVVFMGCDLLKSGCEAIKSEKSDTPPLEAYLAVSERVYANEPFDLDNLREQVSVLSSPGEVIRTEDKTAESRDTPLPAESRESDYETIRVRLSNIEGIMQTMNQIVIKQFQFKKIQDDLSRVGSLFSEKMASMRKAGGEAAACFREFQDLQKGFGEVKKNFSDQITVIERNIYELQEQLMRLTMLPLELIFGTIPRMVEDVSTLLGKDIEWKITGTDVLLDKAILEKLHDPIIHIVRNSLDHGFEQPEERVREGKPARGMLDISCVSEGGNIIIRIADDGRGIDPEKIKRQAVERGLVSEDQLDELSESDIYGFLFSPGFSTKNQVTELSGRGVGLDIVRHNIQKVKGKYL